MLYVIFDFTSASLLLNSSPPRFTMLSPATCIYRTPKARYSLTTRTKQNRIIDIHLRILLSSEILREADYTFVYFSTWKTIWNRALLPPLLKCLLEHACSRHGSILRVRVNPGKATKKAITFPVLKSAQFSTTFSKIHLEIPSSGIYSESRVQRWFRN